jgi:O-antigen/teichoic acid export membrane protein
MGAGQYLVQEKELTTERIRAAWTVQIGLGTTLAVVGLLAAYPVALFYAEPRMFDIMLVLSLNFAISPFGSLTYAWLMREMRYDSLAVMRFSSALASTCVSVTLAWRGWGPIGLAIGSLAGTVVNAIIATFFRPRHFPWLPGWKEGPRVLSFGWRLSLVNLVGYWGGNAPEVLLGKLQGLTAAGLLSRANGLALMFSRLVLDATLSFTLSLLARESRETGRVEGSFLKAVSLVTVLGWSFFLMIVFLAHPIIRLMYGAQWDASIDLARIVAAGMAFGAASGVVSVALLAVGAVNANVFATVSTSIVYLVCSAVGAWYGLLPLALAVGVASALSALIWLHQAQRRIGFGWRTLGAILGRSAAVAASSALAPAAVVLWLGFEPAAPWLALAVGVPGSVVLLAVAARVFRHPIGDELSAIAAGLRLRWSRRSATAA